MRDCLAEERSDRRFCVSEDEEKEVNAEVDEFSSQTAESINWDDINVD